MPFRVTFSNSDNEPETIQGHLVSVQDDWTTFSDGTGVVAVIRSTTISRIDRVTG
jgi:hypothetical protein